MTLHQIYESLVKEFELIRFDVAAWMRNRGINDGDVFRVEDVEEAIEDFWQEKSQNFHPRSSFSKLLEGVEGMTPEQLKEEIKEFKEKIQ